MKLASFLALPLFAAMCAHAACDGAEHRQLDFWVGRWDVTDKGKVIATSVIERFADGCGILENYTQLDGYSGKSINFYDRSLKRWRQQWADSMGNSSEWQAAHCSKTAFPFSTSAACTNVVETTTIVTSTPPTTRDQPPATLFLMSSTRGVCGTSF